MPAKTVSFADSSEKSSSSITHANGLSSQEALKRLQQHGPNVLPKKRPPSAVTIFFRQFLSPLLIILLIAGVITYFAHENVNALVIFSAVLLNAMLGFIQEFKAMQTLHLLSQVLSSEAYVLRDGKTFRVDVASLVPGDIVSLEHGQRIPADGVVIEAENLEVGEAVLTGESSPVEKSAAPQPPPPQNAFEEFTFHKDLSHSVYMGTTVYAGFGKMLIVHTGEKTAMGKLAHHLGSIKQRHTPLQKKLANFSIWLTVVIVGVIGVVLIIGVAKGYESRTLLLVAVALAVSAIPEGLALVLTNILSIAMMRIFKKHGLVRSLAAAETLGSVDVICTDKTGTLTFGELQLVDVIAPNDKKPLLYRAVAATADMRDPLEHEMKHWMEKKGVKFVALAERHPRISHIPFTLDTRFTATQTARHIYAFGAPEILLKRSNLSEKQQHHLMKELKEFGSRGYRLIAVAGKEKRATAELQSTDVQGLDWYGFVVFRDQERQDVGVALKRARAAGVQIKVITGDFALTTKGLLERLGWYVTEDMICTGEQLDALSTQKELVTMVEHCQVFARITPQQKFKIVQTLQHAGHVVAMMGDGVNDALALKTADISIVMRTASDVAKEIADLVLLNNTFATVISAIEEGRAVLTQLQKVLLFLLSGSFAEVVLVMATMVYGLPIPLTAVQILWINILTDGPPSFALIFEKKNLHALESGPKPKDEPLFSIQTSIFAGLISLLTGSFAFGLYLFYLNAEGIETARTLTFLFVILVSLLSVFSMRTLLEPIWKSSLSSNPVLVMTFFGTLLLQVVFISFSATRSLLNVHVLSAPHLLTLCIVVFVLLLSIEGIKAMIRNLQTRPLAVS